MQRGTFRDGDYIALQGSETLERGAVYEATGNLSGFMMQLFPQSWLASGIEELYGLRHSDLTVLAVELNEDGSFRIQVTPNRVAMQGIGIAAAIVGAAALGFLAGLQVEYMYLVVKKTLTGSDPLSGEGSSPFQGIVSTIAFVGVAVLGVWIWMQYKQVST